MTMPRTVAEVLAEHVSLEVECIDRMHLNLYVPMLQRPEGAAHFFLKHRGHRFASSALMSPMSRKFVSAIESFAQQEGVDIVRFSSKQRKEDVAKAYLEQFEAEEGVLFIGKAQEKTATIIRDNLDLGRPDRVGLIFDRRVTRRTPGRFRTRVITDGVIPSLHFEYKHTRIKQYHKEGRALRTETTVHDTYDFEIGRRLHNLSELRKVGFAANRRLLASAGDPPALPGRQSPFDISGNDRGTSPP